MQPEIHNGYSQKNGGVGTVIAKTIEVAMLKAQAKSSTKNLKG